VLALGAVGIGVALGGCVSTEQKATWAHIENARIIASQSSTVVRRAGHEVKVTRVTLLRAGRLIAVAVGLHNTTSHAVNDVPVSVGLRGPDGGRVYLNRARGLNYFKTHVAVIAARRSLTWIFTGRRPHSLSGRPFAVAGEESVTPITVARTIPQLRAVLSGTRPLSDRAAVRVSVTNSSSIPQIGLQVYALAGDSGRYSAAGSVTVAKLGTGQTTTTRIEMVGHLHGARIELEALPTLF
jgi:hypothetical protein